MKHLLLVAVTCFNYGTYVTCSNGASAYNYGNMTQYSGPNGESATYWNLQNQNMYPQTPVQPIRPIPPIQPIQPILPPKLDAWP